MVLILIEIWSEVTGGGIECCRRIPGNPVASRPMTVTVITDSGEVREQDETYRALLAPGLRPFHASAR